METPGQRFEFYIKKIVGMSVPDFASIVDVEDKTLYNVINNVPISIIGKSTLESIKKKYPKFPWEWVQKGGETPDKDTAELVISKPECEECKIKEMEIEVLNKRIFYLERQEAAAMKNAERMERQIVRLEEQLRDCLQRK